MTDPELCECGCGLTSPIATRTRHDIGHVKGPPIRFVRGHNTKLTGGPKWNGGRATNAQGYVSLFIPDHPRAASNGYVAEHVFLAQQALRKPLPPRAEVHHVNGKKGENHRGNLILCQDRAYHMLLHRRARALRSCGNADWRKCPYCKQYDAPRNMYTPNVPGRSPAHRECRNRYDRDRRRAA